MPGIVEPVGSKDNPADILTRNPYINELEYQTMNDEEKTFFEDYYYNGVRVSRQWKPETQERIRLHWASVGQFPNKKKGKASMLP